MRSAIASALLALILAGCAASERVQSGASASAPLPPALAALQTAAERSGFTETTRHAEVVAFVDALAAASPAIHRTDFGQSGEGRALPLVVWGAGAASPEAVRASGKTRVLVFANIHAGEVAGKEALLVLLRSLAAGRHAAWADSLVLLAAPIYNADGNERVAYDNRPLQYGPVGGMGQRANAAGLDLNRDFMKLDAPESRALVRLLRDYDPHVVVDLHTTNGTHMGYELTYAPPLWPDTPAPIAAHLFDEMLPAISARLLEADDYATFHYGNVPGAFGEPVRVPRGWYSFDARPRFGTNYAGVRGRYAILSEAYSYAPFEVRIDVTRRFVEEILAAVHREATRIRRATEQADRRRIAGDSLAVRARFDALPGAPPILLGEVDTLRHPVTGAPMLRQRPVRRPEAMPAYVRFAAAERERAPEAYLVPARLTGVLELLEAHGVRTQPITMIPQPVEAFRVDSVRLAAQPFQGRRAVEAFGRWQYDDAPSEAFVLVPTAQPLGRLAFLLLEPRHEDSAAAWNLLPEGALRAGANYPILRVP